MGAGGEADYGDEDASADDVGAGGGGGGLA